MKAVVIGGSNGIGLAVAKNLIQKNYHVVILDQCEVAENVLPKDSFTYQQCDLLDFNEDQIAALSKDEDVSFLLVTAGIGRIADFVHFHIAEIDKVFKVNTISTIKILKLFYGRICDEKAFHCGVISSISGLLSSPMAAVYAASKAAICRFVESVNIELEVKGTSNRILNVSPASIKGTKFSGGENQLDLLVELAEEIVEHVLAADTLFIPHYEDTFKAVIQRYQNDPHAYGLHSYQYKANSGRAQNTRKVKVGYLSGTFDLFHVGHLNLLRRARQHCDYLIVGVHGSGAWKGKETFIPFEERKAIVGACVYVDKVVDSCLEDSDAWSLWHYDKLFVGSDYKGSERFKRYEAYFADKNVEIVFFPYTKSTSSTQIRETIKNSTSE